MDESDLLEIFDSQVKILLEKNYPRAAKMSETKFISIISPLKDIVRTLQVHEADIAHGYLPFVIVVSHELVPTDYTMAAITKDGKAGITKLDPLTPNDFHTLEDVPIPSKHAYILADIDRGKEYLNVTPHDAMICILQNNRTPLTIDEGVAVVTQYPEFLMKNNCFSLLASRHAGDKRVPAIWINGNKHPNLGWCWENNPHTWLGSVSAKIRIGELKK